MCDVAVAEISQSRFLGGGGKIAGNWGGFGTGGVILISCGGHDIFILEGRERQSFATDYAHKRQGNHCELPFLWKEMKAKTSWSFVDVNRYQYALSESTFGIALLSVTGKAPRVCCPWFKR